MKFVEKLTISLMPVDRGAYNAKAYGEEYLGDMIREAVAVLDHHAKPPEIEVVVYEDLARTNPGYLMIEYETEFEYTAQCSVRQDQYREFDLEETGAHEVVESLMTLRAASIGQLLLSAIQHPIIYSNSDVMIDLISTLPKQI